MGDMDAPSAISRPTNRCFACLQRRSKTLSQGRWCSRLPALSPSIAVTACRFNRYDQRCRTAGIRETRKETRERKRPNP